MKFEINDGIRLWVAGCAILACILAAPLGEAQLTMGTISGGVSDSTGAVVPGTAITARHIETGISRATQTGSTGRYEIPNLPIGHYEVSATIQGFQTEVRAGIELTAGRNAV